MIITCQALRSHLHLTPLVRLKLMKVIRCQRISCLQQLLIRLKTTRGPPSSTIWNQHKPLRLPLLNSLTCPISRQKLSNPRLHSPNSCKNKSLPLQSLNRMLLSLLCPHSCRKKLMNLQQITTSLISFKIKNKKFRSLLLSPISFRSRTQLQMSHHPPYLTSYKTRTQS